MFLEVSTHPRVQQHARILEHEDVQSHILGVCDHHYTHKLLPKCPLSNLKHRLSKREEKQVPRKSFFKGSPETLDRKVGMVPPPFLFAPGAAAAQALFQMGSVKSGRSTHDH